MLSRTFARWFAARAAWAFLLGVTWILLPLGGIARPVPGTDDPADEHIQKGDAMFGTEDWDGAIKEYREAVRLAPDSSKAHFALGMGLGEVDDRDGAMTEFKEALRLDPNSAEAHDGVGWIMARRGVMDEAVKEFHQAAELKPDYARARYHLGWAAEFSGHFDDAVKECRKAVEMSLNDSYAHQFLGWELYRSGDVDGGIREYRESVRLKPAAPSGHDGLAWVLYVKGDWKSARAEYDAALRLKPNDPETHVALGIALYNRNDLDGALKEYREAVRVKPGSGEAHTDVGEVLRAKGDVDGAIAEYKKAAEVAPKYGPGHSHLATEYRRKGEWDPALREAQYATTLQADDSRAHLEYGLALEHRDSKGDRESALFQYRKALQFDPNDRVAAINYGRLQSELKYLPSTWSPSMVRAFTIACALVPSFLLLGFFRGRDLYPEPARALWGTFLFGAAIIYPVLILDGILNILVMPIPGPLLHGMADAFFTAAVPEELMKFAVLILFSTRLKAFDEPMDGVVYGAVASLGFATYENFQYVTTYGLTTAFFRAFTSVPGHAFMGAVMGYYLGQWKFGVAARRKGALVKAYLIPVALHWIYDFPLLASEQAGGLTGHARAVAYAYISPLMILSSGILIAEAIWVVRLVNRLHREQIKITRDAVAAAAAAEGAMDIVAIVNAPDAPPSAWLGWVLALIGGIVATIGGFLALAVFVVYSEALLNGNTEFDLWNGSLVGGIPLLIGMMMFIYGVKRIHASSRRLPPPAPVIAPASA